MLLELDGTLIVIAVSFIIFAFVMQQIFYGPMTKIRNERESYIDKNKKQAEDSLNKSEELLKNYHEKILQAKISVNEVISKSTASANLEKASIVKENSDIESEKIKQAKEITKQEKAEAERVLKIQIGTFAENIVKKVLGNQIQAPPIPIETVNKVLGGEK
jgi:F0F1-type ATP synthase membrane subunit b/b'